MSDLAAAGALSDDATTEGQVLHLESTTVRSLGWSKMTVSVEDRKVRGKKELISGVSGIVQRGELLAIMGPSGAGKSTLLNALAHRRPPPDSVSTGQTYVNGSSANAKTLRRISAYVEQEDALVGSLTVRETLDFAARLSLPSRLKPTDRARRIEAILKAFGLSDQADNLIGTPVRKGISGGQKRRLSVASQLITSPKILFLDEPTSGLDSAAAFEVVDFLKKVAKQYGLIVIASMHQPSTSTFNMCDRLLLLSQGKIAYSGPVTHVQSYFDDCGFSIPEYMNPAEYVIDFVNTDFAHDEGEVAKQLQSVQCAWQRSEFAALPEKQLDEERARGEMGDVLNVEMLDERAGAARILVALVHRSFIKSYRDVIAYGVRMAMYIGLALMMGTVWLRLEPIQENIQSFVNAIFFGGAFMSFMAVAYIPAFLEDHAIFARERANGLYGPMSFLVANFLIGIPYLFSFSLLFSLVTYWLSNFRPTASAFFTWTAWLFLDLLAAESLVILISSLVPIFVVALAGTAFVNGLMMCTGGFLVQTRVLNAFYRYVFHYIDYQAPVFEAMMVNEFQHRRYACAKGNGGCSCSYRSRLEDQCLIDGTAVLEEYGYSAGHTGRLVGIMLAIILAHRLLGWVTLHFRTSGTVRLQTRNDAVTHNVVA